MLNALRVRRRHPLAMSATLAATLLLEGVPLRPAHADDPAGAGGRRGPGRQAAPPADAENAAPGHDPTTGDCLTASEAAVGLRSDRHLRGARSQLLVCAAASCPSDVRAECTYRVDEVNRAIPTIVFDVKDPAGGDVAGVRITMDGEPLVDHLEGTAISLDPGEHRFGFMAPGQPLFERTLLIREGEKGRRERVLLGAASPGAAADSARKPSGSGSTPGPSHALAWTFLATGAVGVAVGATTGIIALGKHSTLDDECGASRASCPPNAAADIDSIGTLSTVSTVAFVVGGAGLAAGTILFLTEGKGSAERPAATATLHPWLGLGAIGAKGTFE